MKLIKTHFLRACPVLSEFFFLWNMGFFDEILGISRCPPPEDPMGIHYDRIGYNLF